MRGNINRCVEDRSLKGSTVNPKKERRIAKPKPTISRVKTASQSQKAGRCLALINQPRLQAMGGIHAKKFHQTHKSHSGKKEKSVT